MLIFVKNLRFRIVPFAVVVLAAAACSSTPSGPTAPSSITGSTSLTAEVLASTWRLVSIQNAGQPEQAAPGGADYLATFENGRISTRADCNLCSGQATLSSGAVMTIGPVLACTRAACPTMEFESVYVSLLAGDHVVVVDGRSLTLQSNRGVVRFER